MYQGKYIVADGSIAFGQQVAVLQQEHTFAETQLIDLANQQRSAGNTAGANDLEAQAQVEGAQARVFANSYLHYAGALNSDGTVTFDRGAQEAVAVGESATLQTLGDQHSRELDGRASAARTKAQQTALATALFVGAMFFLTVANLGWRHRRLHALIPSLLLALAGVVVLAIAGIT